MLFLLPCIEVQDKVLQDEPGDVDDNQEGETGQTGCPLVHLSLVDECGGEVDKTGHHAPGSVDAQAVECESVAKAVPEHSTPSRE